MSRRKGLSVDEKRERMRDLFLETKTVYTLKELEKVASKEKGIVSQTVEEILKSLCDDNMVMSDKIGTSNYFWAFPSQEVVLKTNRIESLEKELETQKRKRAEMESQVEELQKGREESDERTKKMTRLEELRKQNSSLKDEIALYAENDPELITALCDDSKEATTHANRWTDNIFTMRSYAEQNCNFPQADFNMQFNIPDELDYVE
eukprot:TRINITY_DN20662_c0_g1_i1.p1 TRINITY_DN20662_c0_g1~~TRINITY_DN20662_c0_g1_i1.p1  ORF type:complete len:206 (-),score=61.21 TRINITY_DN20662_c0_g1_i1:49-666(-)